MREREPDPERVIAREGGQVDGGGAGQGRGRDGQGGYGDVCQGEGEAADCPSRATFSK